MKSIKISFALLSLLSVIASTAVAVEIKKDRLLNEAAAKHQESKSLDKFVAGAGVPDTILNLKSKNGNVVATVMEYHGILKNGKKVYVIVRNGQPQALTINGDVLLKRYS